MRCALPMCPALAPTVRTGDKPWPVCRAALPRPLVCETFHARWGESWGRGMREQREPFDYDRYRQLIVQAVDETRRMALINLLIEEGARDRLAAAIAAGHTAATTKRIGDVLGRPRS